jgi:hypothetical protein
MFRKIGTLTIIADEVWKLSVWAAGLYSMKSGEVAKQHDEIAPGSRLQWR